MQDNELRLEITRLSNALEQAKYDLNELRRKAEKQFKPVYFVRSVTYGKHFASDPKNLRITLQATTSTIKQHAELCKVYGSFKSLDESRHSVGYVYDADDNELSHIGGGWLLLDEKQPTTPKEWELLKAGDLTTIQARAKHDGLTIVAQDC